MRGLGREVINGTAEAVRGRHSAGRRATASEPVRISCHRSLGLCKRPSLWALSQFKLTQCLVTETLPKITKFEACRACHSRKFHLEDCQ